MKDKILHTVLIVVMCIDPEVLIAEGDTLPIDNFSSVEEEADKYYGILAAFGVHISFRNLARR